MQASDKLLNRVTLYPRVEANGIERDRAEGNGMEGNRWKVMG